MKRLETFLEALKENSKCSCVEDTGASHTYGALLEEIKHWQCRLDQVKLSAGTVVGLRADYSIAAIAALLALLSRHAIVALIPRDRDDARYIADAHVTQLVDMGVDGGCLWRAIPSSTRHPLIDRLSQSGDGGIIVFTSGATGRPKAALHSAERFLYKYQAPGRRLRTLAFLLFDHIAGLDTLFYTLASGGTLVLTRHRDPWSILALIESHRVQVLPASPSFLRLLCAAKNADDKYDLTSLKVITYGSETMDKGTLAKLNLLFPGIKIAQKYGTTEVGSPRTMSRGNDSLWLKFREGGAETKIVDGVLWIRSEGAILGYLNASSPVDEDGWYCTGDEVEMDGEWLRFCGRTSDAINVGGEKVSPVEVEQCILELPFVREVVVAGEAHPLLGQVVAARILLANADVALEDAKGRIWKHCRQRLARHKLPVKITFSAHGFSGDRQKTLRNVH